MCSASNSKLRFSFYSITFSGGGSAKLSRCQCVYRGVGGGGKGREEKRGLREDEMRGEEERGVRRRGGKERQRRGKRGDV
jgi:hypothetical protein